MSENTAKSSLTTCKANGQAGEVTANAPILTAREQEVMNLLLKGSIPKEIASTLNISHSTVLDHQKSLYRKLDIHSIRELLVKYSAGSFAGCSKTSEMTQVFIKNPAGETGATKAVFKRWDTIADDSGSYVNFTPKIELIQDNYTETYAITGNTSYNGYTYAGILGHPNPSTFEAMRNAKGFSFTCLGDGNTYEVKITTTEARLNAGYNFYGKEFATENGVISIFKYNIDELTPLILGGKEVPYNPDSIECFLIQTCSKGDFNLKFWDIKFF